MNKPNDKIWKFFKNGNPSHRRCSNCKEFKTLAQYAKSERTKFGVQNVCKDCMYNLVTTDTSKISKAQARKYVEEIMPYNVVGDCWEFTGHKGPQGYGRCVVNYVMVRPHVVALMSKLERPVAEGMEASHLCHNSKCVNPDHLVEETHVENMARGKAWRRAQMEAA